MWEVVGEELRLSSQRLLDLGLLLLLLWIQWIPPTRCGAGYSYTIAGQYRNGR